MKFLVKQIQKGMMNNLGESISLLFIYLMKNANKVTFSAMIQFYSFVIFLYNIMKVNC